MLATYTDGSRAHGAMHFAQQYHISIYRNILECERFMQKYFWRATTLINL